MTNNSMLVQITNTTRLHIADSAKPQGARDVNGRKVPFTRTTKAIMPLMIGGANELKMEGVPVINANLLRGRLRRNIATLIFDSLRKRELGASVDFIHLLTSLATSGSPSSAKNLHNALQQSDPVKAFTGKGLKPEGDEYLSTDNRVEYLAAMTSDPFTALFGGGPNLWKSRLITPDFIPNLTLLAQPEFINGKYAHLFDRDPLSVSTPYRLLEYVGAIRGDDVFKHVEMLGRDSKELETWVKIEAGQKTSDEGEDSAPKSNLRNMMTVETVCAGTPFIGEIIIKNEDVSSEVFDVMNGLILVALEALNGEQIGGLVRNGWGRVSVSFASEKNQKQIDAALAYIDSVTVTDIMEAYGVALR